MTHIVILEVDLVQLLGDETLPLLSFALDLLVLHEDVEDEGAGFEAQVVAGEVEEFEVAVGGVGVVGGLGLRA